MTRSSAVLCIAVACFVVGNAAHAARRSSRNRNVPLRSQSSPWMWVPQVEEGQVPEQMWAADPWLPETIELQSQNQQQPLLWFPQHIRVSGPEDVWLPTADLATLQTQQSVWWWPEKRPVRDECTFSYDDVPDGHIHPFLVDASRRVFLYPDIVRGRRRVTMPGGSTVLAACPGHNNALAKLQRSYVTVTCEGSLLRRGRTPVDWADLGCQEELKPTLKRDGSCGRDSHIYRIGWTIRRGLFVPQITACFNARLEASTFTSHEIHGRFIDAKVIEPSRPSFKTNRMFSVSLNRSYRKRMQKALARNLLHSTSHLTTEGEEYFAKGHLAPDADFVLEAEQDATYYYVNAAPQWQAVNNGNWKKLENAVRDLAERRLATFKVYTGTHGILELPDSRMRLTKVYLGLSFDEKKVPVPAVLWKVIHDNATSTAVAFVVVNDIRDNDSWNARQPPCPDLCSHLPWVDWDTSDVSSGLTFCCSVDALAYTFPHVPELGRVGLLFE